MKARAIHLKDICIRDGFWKEKTRMVADEMLPYQWKALNDQIPGAEPSHALENFRIASGETSGVFAGTIFQDSDVGKWIEAACCSLARNPDQELEAWVEETIRLIGASQQPDGYIDTWITIKAPHLRWTDLSWGHELYCGGHLMEAAVAHFTVSGKRYFLEIMMRYADCLIAVFGPGAPHDGKCCGHPEIELALQRLSEASGCQKYAELARHFLLVRGRRPEDFQCPKPSGFDLPITRWFDADYFLAHAPVTDLHDADGHSVRAMYLFTSMAREWGRSNDPDLGKALGRLWASTVERRMYITGGLGSQAHAERFTLDYDLPPDTAYTETCASIGLIFWAAAMFEAEPSGKYADILERSLYNGALSGVSLDGTKYFYVNPLETIPPVAKARHDHEHVKTERVAWFGCACCPPNIARLVASVGTYSCSSSEDSLWINQYIDSTGVIRVGGTAVRYRLRTSYPYDGKIDIEFGSGVRARFTLRLRIPGWCTGFSCTVNGQTIERAPDDGYIAIARDWKEHDRIGLELEMIPRLVMPSSRIAELAGRVAVMRGPLVYCAEEIDNGPDLHRLSIDPATAVFHYPEVRGVSGEGTIAVDGIRDTDTDDGLYRDWNPDISRGTETDITLVPYHTWGNRAPGQEMRIWLRVYGTAVV